MAKAEQALVLDPVGELHFKGPFSEVTTTYLTLTNPTDKSIAFKVKTTAPKTYCVRPNGGCILPKKAAQVIVMLQPFDPDTEDRSKDKFMVQSIYVPENQEWTDGMWHSIPPEGMMNSKLKCIFDSVPEAKEIAANIVDAPKTKGKPTVVPDSKGSDTEKEAIKLSEEFKKLKSELADARQENSALKEEGIRYRMASSEGARRKASPKPFESDSQQPTAKKQLSNYLIMISLFIFLLGIYIGKYVL